MLGKAQSKILSCVDLKDAFHSLKLTDRAKDFCGILPYFGSHHYRYEVMPMALSISPCKWIQYIGFVMEKLPYPQNYMLVHSKEEDHMDRILDMLRALVEYGLKLSPRNVSSLEMNWFTWATSSRLQMMVSLSLQLKPDKKQFSIPLPPQILRNAKVSVEL